MNEKQKLALILLLPVFLGLLSEAFLRWFFTRDYYAESWRLAINGSRDFIEVEESIKFVLKRPYHELFRSYFRSGPQANIELIGASCPAGSEFGEYRKSFYTEFACNGYFPPGKYEIKFRYRIPSPYECGSDSCLLHWVVLNEFPRLIKKMEISVNSKNYAVFPKKLINLPPEQVVEVAALYPSNYRSYERIKSAEKEFERLKLAYKKAELVLFLERYPHLLLPLISSLVLLLIYLLFGVDYEPSNVPELLHYPPENLKPHEFDFLYGKYIGKIESTCLDAVLLELARRGYLKLGEKRIYVLDKKDEDLDVFEWRIWKFLQRYGKKEGNYIVFDVDEFLDSCTSGARLNELGRRAYRELSELLKPTEALKKKLKQVYSDTGHKLARFFLVSYLALTVILLAKLEQYMSILPFALTLGIEILQIIFTALLDDYVFGRYTKEGRIKKAYWDAFARLLGDYSLIEKYRPSDLSMWGTWLIYATVLGYAKNVIKAMKKYRINLDFYALDRKPSYFSRVYISMSARAVRVSGSSFGGGFGGGGGGAR